MKKYLVTGFSGFVSKHFVDYLATLPARSEVLGLDTDSPPFAIDRHPGVSCTFKQVNLLDKGQLGNVIHQYRPDYVLHLASYSSVSYSWKNPLSSFTNNTNIFLNLLQQIRDVGIPCRILSVGSSEQYGNVSRAQTPLRENSPLDPVSPYAVARVAQEMLSKVFGNGYGMDIVMTRSFNHIGPDQPDVFAIPSFAEQLARIERSGSGRGTVATGDLSIVRDFVDVRDVVRAYALLLHDGTRGEVYNICSGKGFSLRELIDIMASHLEITVDTEVNPNFVRPSDNEIIVGSFDKLHTCLGWRPEIPIEQSLKDILEHRLTKLDNDPLPTEHRP